MSALVSVEHAKMSKALSALDEAYLQTLLNSASGIAERYCHREFAKTTHTDETYDGDGHGGQRDLMLRHFPIITLTALKFLNHVDGSEDVITVANLLKDLPMGQILFKPQGSDGYLTFPKGTQNIVVTYDAGFETVPAPVQRAVLMIAAFLHGAAAHDLSLQSERLGDYAYTLAREEQIASSMPAAARGILGQYKDWLV